MSTIPPNWMASVIQSQGSQDRAGATKKQEAADQAARSDKSGFPERLQDVIENSDKDSEVYADAEGAGSQGKQSSEEEEREENQQDSEPGAAGGLDIEA